MSVLFGPLAVLWARLGAQPTSRRAGGLLLDDPPQRHGWSWRRTMNDSQAVAGLLRVAGPVLGLIPVGHPALIPIWSMPRDALVATVAAHRVAWAWLNAGFTLAPTATAAGLLALSGAAPPDMASAGQPAGSGSGGRVRVR